MPLEGNYILNKNFRAPKKCVFEPSGLSGRRFSCNVGNHNHNPDRMLDNQMVALDRRFPFVNLDKEVTLKCCCDQILDTHFFTFSYTTGLSKISCQISICYEQYNSCFLDLYFREFTAAINFPCSKSGLRIGENDVIFSKMPHVLKL